MKFTDITGQKFGDLTAIEYCGYGKWKCECSCGKVIVVRGDNLRTGNSKSCGCKRKGGGRKPQENKILGRKFGRLTVLQLDHISKNMKYYKCICDCGNETVVQGSNLLSGHTVSCGCRLKEIQNNIDNVQKEFGSNVNILCKEANRNNKLHIRGVFYNKSLNLYVAAIQYKKKPYILKTSRNIEPCIKARKEAEIHVQKDFIKWYEEYKTGQKLKEKPPQS